MGTYLEVDERGYLTRVANVSAIQERWSDAVEATRRAYLTKWGNGLHSVYIRGSVAKGSAIEHVSDIDSFAVISDGTVEAADYDAWETRTEKDLQQRFPHVAGFELDCIPVDNAIARDNIHALVIKLESVCVFGEDLAARIDGFKPTAEMAFQTRWFHHHLDMFQSAYPQETASERVGWIGWIMRRFLRLGMELVMEQEQRFTRDLYLCYESFASHYPEQEGDMFRSLELAVNSVADPETSFFTRRFGKWLTEEADAKLARWGITRA